MTTSKDPGDVNNSKLRDAERLESLGQLSSGIAHDFNNHLQIILGYTELIGGDSDCTPNIKKSVDYIEQAVERAGTLVNQLLAFSRDHQVKFGQVDLNETLSLLMPMLSRLLNPDIKIQLKLDPELDPILADDRLLEQIIVNLTVNARDAITGAGVIKLQTERLPEPTETNAAESTQHSSVRLIVEDSGIGMDEATVRRAFEPFFTTKPVGKGTGLGLATVYGIVQQLQGQITIDSEPNRGTKVIAEFSAVKKDTLAEESNHDLLDYSGSETVLLVEDEVVIREMIATQLRDVGYTVLTGNDGQHALNIASTYQGPIDLCLFDVVMPRLNGYDTYERILNLGVKIPALFITGSTSRVAQRRTRYWHVQKPFSRVDLLVRVRQCLDTAQDSSSHTGG